MPTRAGRRKDPAAVALGRRGGKKGGPARAAKLSPEQRSESARNAVKVRWAKARDRKAAPAKGRPEAAPVIPDADTSDDAVFTLLKRIKMTNNATEIRYLSDQLERAIFHKQYGH